MLNYVKIGQTFWPTNYFCCNIWLIYYYFTNKIGLSYYYATLSNEPLICVATITGLKIATDIVAKTTKHYGLVATKKMATTLLCADDRHGIILGDLWF